jgi:hypothetical protein
MRYGMIISKLKQKRKKTGNLQKDLVELILLRQFIANQAIPYIHEMVENAIAGKVIIFTSFTEELETLSKHFENWVFVIMEL